MNVRAFGFYEEGFTSSMKDIQSCLESEWRLIIKLRPSSLSCKTYQAYSFFLNSSICFKECCNTVVRMSCLWLFLPLLACICEYCNCRIEDCTLICCPFKDSL